MKRCSKLFLGILNVVILAFSLFQAAFVVMSNHGSSNQHCYKNSGLAIFWISAWLLIVSLLGLLGSCCKSRCFQNCYVWMMLVTTIVGITFSIFMFLTLPNQSANSTYQNTQSGNWLKAFSPFMRSALVNSKDWSNARTCLADMHFCQWFNNQSPNLRLEYLHFLQLGCCRPPTRCGFLQKNDTYWEIPKSGFNSQDGECQMWAEGGDNGVCYDCDSCKAGYLAKFQMDWHADKGVFVAVVIFLLLSTSLSFWAFGFRNQTEIEKEQKKYRDMVYA